MLSISNGVLFLILAIVSIILLLTITQNGNNNDIVNAQKQNDMLLASLRSTISSSINVVSSNNNNIKTTTIEPTLISLPLSRGYVDGMIEYFIATDASDNQTAIEISKNLGFKVNFAPSLALIPQSSRQQGYEFLNGIRGQGAFGFQLPVASKLPGDKDYSPIVQLNFVKWNSNSSSTSSGKAATNSYTSNTIRELKSASEIMSAQKNDELTITRTNILINSPAISIR
ncbi:MAG TPA: hypothetical protein VE619_04010 [Nitrososphaeraceae archaeon]|nr:hypothetical protein [Nitrososphaeraceae archaeon]